MPARLAEHFVSCQKDGKNLPKDVYMKWGGDSSTFVNVLVPLCALEEDKNRSTSSFRNVSRQGSRRQWRRRGCVSHMILGSPHFASEASCVCSGYVRPHVSGYVVLLLMPTRCREFRCLPSHHLEQHSSCGYSCSWVSHRPRRT